MWNQILNYQIYSNTGQDYLIFLGVFLLVVLILKLIQKVVLLRLKKLSTHTITKFDDLLVDILNGVMPIFYFALSLYLALQFINVNSGLNRFFNVFFMAVLVCEIIRALVKIIGYFSYQAMKKNDNDNQAKATVKTLNIFVKIILWSIGLLLILSNAGINVTSLIAGLGIGGIAVALALQNILGDIFSSFSILVDKPFQVGDYIKIGNDAGVVEKIGIKTTRLKTLDGQVLVVANKELTTVRVENFRQMQKRRALFSLGLIYETKFDLLERVPSIIRGVIEAQEKTEFERCNFKSYGDFSLNYEVSFYAKVDSYNEYLDVLEKVNLGIFKQFKKEGIEFAYPTNVQYSKKEL